MIYSLLGYLAMGLTPIGAVIFFGWRVYTAVLEMTGSVWLSLLGGLSAATGLEIVGIFAGHVSMVFWERKDGRWRLAAAIMVVYVAIGVVELWGTVGVVMFLISPLVYVLVALRVGLEDEIERETAVNESRTSFDLEQLRLDRELAREMKRARLKAKLAASRQDGRQDARQHTRQDTGKLPGDWRQLSREQRHDLAHLSRTEREKLFPALADRTARKWHERLDKIAERNGSYMSLGG